MNPFKEIYRSESWVSNQNEPKTWQRDNHMDICHTRFDKVKDFRSLLNPGTTPIPEFQGIRESWDWHQDNPMEVLFSRFDSKWSELFVVCLFGSFDIFRCWNFYGTEFTTFDFLAFLAFLHSNTSLMKGFDFIFA